LFSLVGLHEKSMNRAAATVPKLNTFVINKRLSGAKYTNSFWT
jgi:hypothetical protein